MIQCIMLEIITIIIIKTLSNTRLTTEFFNGDGDLHTHTFDKFSVWIHRFIHTKAVIKLLLLLF